MYRQSRATLEELGWRFDAALTSAIASGPVELIAGDAGAAEAELRRDYDALAAMGERNYISTTAAFLAEALYRQGRDEEALVMTEQSEEIAAADDVATQYLWRSVRAKLLARRGVRGGGDARARGDPHHRGGAGPGLPGLRLHRPGRGPAHGRPSRRRGPGRRRIGRPLRPQGQHRIGRQARGLRDEIEAEISRRAVVHRRARR